MWTTLLSKMKTDLQQKVQYSLLVGADYVPVNDWIGHTLVLDYQNRIVCSSCQKVTNKSFSDGFCYRCFISVPEASDCVLRPELCLAHEGKGRDAEWELLNHLQPHVVYLALASQVKVGVTRSTQVPTRWIDQGASQAVVLANTPNRYIAGCLEVALKAHLTDKTSWQKMLKNEVPDLDMLLKKQDVVSLVPEAFSSYICSDAEVVHISYPVQAYPEKVKSLGFDKIPSISGRLVGIKGQYLIFEDGSVVNVRKHTGYEVLIRLA